MSSRKNKSTSSKEKVSLSTIRFENLSTSTSPTLKKEKSPIRVQISSSDEVKKKDYLDIEDDLTKISQSSTIQKMISMPDYTETFLGDQAHLVIGQYKQSRLFKFKFFNIYSYMLLTCKKSYYELSWLINRNCLYPSQDMDKGFGLKPLSISWQNKKEATIDNISTLAAPIPTLQIGSTVYNGFSVCMILALALLTKLDFNKADLTDDTYVISKCSWNDEKIAISLLDVRHFTCGGSIYNKFGFRSADDDSTQLCRLTTGEILEDYTERIHILRDDIRNTNVSRSIYKRKDEWKKRMYKAILILELLSKESIHMSIGDWLLQFKVGNERNCHYNLLVDLIRKPFGSKLKYKGLIIPETRLFTLYSKLTSNKVNNNIAGTYQDILDKAGIKSYEDSLTEDSDSW